MTEIRDRDKTKDISQDKGKTRKGQKTKGRSQRHGKYEDK
jgi:hypothetical protein